MSRIEVVLFAMLGAAAAASLGVWFSWVVVCVAEVFVAAAAYSTYTIHAAAAGAARASDAATPLLRENVQAMDVVSRPYGAMTSRQIRQLLGDSEVGVCTVGADGVITHIEGGALRSVGAEPRMFIGQQIGEPYRSAGFEPALAGVHTLFSGMDPIGGKLQQVILYTPTFDGAGEPDGVVIWWVMVPAGQRVEVTNG